MSGEQAIESPRIVWSYNDEDFSHDSLQEAMEAYGDTDELEVGQKFSFGEVDAPNSNWVDVEDIIDMIGERAHDVGGEHAEGFPTVKEDAKKELAEFLEQWQAVNCWPHFYRVKNVKEYALTSEDIAEATGETK